MNQLVSKIYSLLKNDQNEQNLIDPAETFISTAAVPGAEEPKELHPGRRRLKENFTSHWDLDYLPRKEVDKIMAKAQEKQG